MTKTAKLSMVGVLVVALLALFAVAGCTGDNPTDANSGSNDNAANTDNGSTNGDGNNAGDNGDNGGNNGDAANSGNNADNGSSNQMGDGSSVGEGTVLKVTNGWVAYSEGDLLALVDSSSEVDYQWTAEIQGDSVLKDTDADLPSSTYYDQNADDVVGSAGMHVFGFLADTQNNGESTITLKLARTTDANDVNTTIVLKATVENGAFTNVTVQE